MRTVTLNNEQQDSSSLVMNGNHYDGTAERPASTDASSPSSPTDTGPFPLTCPVSSCKLVFEGEMTHLDFCKHLQNPDLGRVDYEKVTWLNLHRREHERCLAALECNKAELEGEPRASELEPHATNMGGAGEKLVPQELATCEGTCAIVQMDVQYYARVLLGSAAGINQ
ncbi:hypothetical protein HOY80DRAFT_1036957 [Tuber brumale]|nr:hypothetical protein HOY80DRAFT_1036957 [Tuber brumale]